VRHHERVTALRAFFQALEARCRLAQDTCNSDEIPGAGSIAPHQQRLPSAHLRLSHECDRERNLRRTNDIATSDRHSVLVSTL